MKFRLKRGVKMYLEKITLSFIQPCTTDSLRIRIKAITSRDISDIFPYLNTYLKNGIYNKKANTFTFNYGSLQEIKHVHLHILPDKENENHLDIQEIYAKLKDED